MNADATARAERATRLTSTDAAFVEYFRCDDHLLGASRIANTSDEGYFRFGGAVCYGRTASGTTTLLADEPLPDIPMNSTAENGGRCLPLDLSEVVLNLRRERYRRVARPADVVTGAPTVRSLYYALRPVLGVSIRKHLQRLRLSGWQTIPFPRWPVDASVETLMRAAMTVVLKSGACARIPFIWFWPDGADSTLMMTHDVEGASGVQFCDRLMDLDESFGIASSFQIVPAFRQPCLSEAIRSRGFEVNLHDWNHDGHLFRDKQLFLERAALINAYALQLNCRGFRSAVMYREQDWFDALCFDYDMSVPNVAHLDPQRGGCCTVMPYFVGRLLELPLTTIQDYSLLHILGDYSIDLWKTQIDLIRSEHGLISFIVHPDYVRGPREQAVYVQLLSHLQRLREDHHVWAALPGDIEQWWRRRSAMHLVADGAGWRVEGPDAARARVAYAVLDGDRTVYEVDDGSHRSRRSRVEVANAS